MELEGPHDESTVQRWTDLQGGDPDIVEHPGCSSDSACADLSFKSVSIVYKFAKIGHVRHNVQSIELTDGLLCYAGAQFKKNWSEVNSADLPQGWAA